ncbi:hypothetical protein EDD21DRAFT_390913, partial [Dissophora ornata]
MVSNDLKEVPRTFVVPFSTLALQRNFYWSHTHVHGTCDNANRRPLSHRSLFFLLSFFFALRIFYLLYISFELTAHLFLYSLHAFLYSLSALSIKFGIYSRSLWSLTPQLHPFYSVAFALFDKSHQVSTRQGLKSESGSPPSESVDSLAATKATNTATADSVSSDSGIDGDRNGNTNKDGAVPPTTSPEMGTLKDRLPSAITRMLTATAVAA